MELEKAAALARAVGTTSPPRVADIIVELLVAAGVRHVFGVPGGAISPLHDALLARPEVQVVTSRHESGAMFAAAGCARATQRLAVVLVTSGPGVLSALNGLASAACDGLPVLLVAGEVPRARFGTGALQDGSSYHLDIVGMARSIAKLSIELREPGHAVPLFARAIDTALSGCRGPVLITLPIDVGTAHSAPPRLARSLPPVPDVTDAAAEEAVAFLRAGERPLILAGAGVRWGDGPRELARFAERLQIPVVTTPKGKGVFPEGHPLSLGVFGFGGHPSATGYVEGGVDTLLAVGTGLGEVATNGFSPHLRAAKRIVHIDIDPAKMARHWPIALGLVGDAASVLGRMRDVVTGAQPAPKFFGVRRHADPSAAGDGSEGRIQPHRALWELQQVMPAGTVYTSDIGEHLLFAVQYLRIDQPDGFCVMSGLGSMGSGIGAALGIKVARPRSPVVAVCGDGCFAMSVGDIATAAREKIDVVVFVMNDERYGMCEIGHEAVYGRRPDYSTAPMCIVDVARGAGARGVVVRHTGDVLALGELLSKPGPLVVDVQIDRSTRMPKSQRNEVLAQRPKMFN